GRRLATCSQNDKVVRVWDADTGRELLHIDGPGAGVDEVQFSPDGKLLATGAWDQPVYLWDAATGKLRHKLADHPCLGPHFRFSADSRALATASHHTTVGVWDVATGRLQQELPAPPNQVASLVAFADGRLLAIERPDGDDEAEMATVSLWDLAAGRCVRRFAGHRGLVNCAVLSDDGRSLAFSADGRRLATGSQDTTVLVWDMTARQAPHAKARLAADDLARLWDELQDADAAKAWRALWALAAAGDQAVALLHDRLPPAPAADARQIARWVAELDHPQFAVRERATAALREAADQAEGALRAALVRTRSAEVRQRVRRVLDGALEPARSPEELRAVRAVELLEDIATAAAPRLLADPGR